MAITRQERDDLVRRAIDADERRFADDAPEGREGAYLDEQFYASVADYFDGLPRVVMSACPHCGSAFRHSFDPWGFDGPWWGDTAIYKPAEPPPCEHYAVMLGAVKIPEAAVPAQVVMDSIPGPEVPFVVPRLLELPDMIAVISELAMEVGGPAYPVVYFSTQRFTGDYLHQPWRRSMLFYQNDGRQMWTAANDVWDFDLKPWVDKGKVCWVELDPDVDEPPVQRGSDDNACPYVALAGERAPQTVWSGGRALLTPPNGEPLSPFEGP